MVTFRNNNNYRKGRFRSNDRNFKRNNGENHKFKSEFSSNVNFQRKIAPEGREKNWGRKFFRFRKTTKKNTVLE